MAISPSRASPPATPRSAARASSRAWWCGHRRSPPNYDPDVFPDPLRFDIHRKPKRILSFGAGPHHCIGNILGRTTITIAIRRLLARFPKAHLIDPDFTPVYGGAVGELRLQSLPMRITMRPVARRMSLAAAVPPCCLRAAQSLKHHIRANPSSLSCPMRRAACPTRLRGCSASICRIGSARPSWWRIAPAATAVSRPA